MVATSHAYTAATSDANVVISEQCAAVRSTDVSTGHGDVLRRRADPDDASDTAAEQPTNAAGTVFAANRHKHCSNKSRGRTKESATWTLLRLRAAWSPRQELPVKVQVGRSHQKRT